ncbi:MAG: hypothetical protein Tsb002_02380 [Wenzhouxiangellaceae bacterium]
MQSTRIHATAVGAIALAVSFAVSAQNGLDSGEASTEITTVRGAQLLGPAVAPVQLNKNLLELPQIREWQPGDPVYEIPQFQDVYTIDREPLQPNIGDPLRDNNDQTFGTPLHYQIDVDVNGSPFSGANPADPVGDVGNQYYIQAINQSGTRILILDKTNGATVTSFQLDSLAAGSGTGCGNGVGDPIVMFDETVDNGPSLPDGRWVLTEFTFNSMCVYISQNDDPVGGGWYLYEFGSATGGLPDYPKYGVWPNAYFVGSKESNPALPRIYAFDRNSMLAGAVASPAQVFAVPALGAFTPWQMLLPADWDGTTPPPNPNTGLFFRHKDDESHTPGTADPTRDFLELWQFNVDWATPANSSLVGPSNIATAEFDSHLCGLAFPPPCVLQPAGPSFVLPTPALMWRVQYRNLGSHQSIAGSFMIDADGADQFGVRWFELRGGGGSWSVHQEGTMSPDATYRFLPSMAMDEYGNMLLAYNVSDGSSIHPGIRYTGRFVNQPAGTMPHPELDVIAGTASNGSSRYGDYTAMTVDPVDGRTFWYTAMHSQASTWSTRVTSFVLPDTADLSLDKRGQCLRLTPSGFQNCPFWPSPAIQAGNWLIFTISVTNSGPYPATNVEVRDVLANFLNYFFSAASVGSYNPATGIWTIPTLGVGQTANLTIYTSANSNASSIRNFAEVWSVDQDDPDSTPGNGPSRCYREDDDDLWSWPFRRLCISPIDISKLRLVPIVDASREIIKTRLQLEPSEGLTLKAIGLDKLRKGDLVDIAIHDNTTKYDTENNMLIIRDNKMDVTLVHRVEPLDEENTVLMEKILAEGLENVKPEVSQKLLNLLQDNYRLDMDLIIAEDTSASGVSAELILAPTIR